MTSTTRTPAMRQYDAMKEKAGNAILFFRMGDFYEMFEEDAKLAAKELGLTLTSRGKSGDEEIPLAGIPYHAADRYIAELSRKGYDIAICEQITTKEQSGIVERDIVRIITPGTTIQEDLLVSDTHNFLAAIHCREGLFTTGCIDVSTGDMFVFSSNALTDIVTELQKYAPSEILLEDSLFDEHQVRTLLSEYGFHKYQILAFAEASNKKLTETFGKFAMDSCRLDTSGETVCATLILYVEARWHLPISHVKLPRVRILTQSMQLGEETIRNLELFTTQRDGEHEGSLHAILAKSITGAGGRLLRQWMWSPLRDRTEISRRLSAVEELFHSKETRSKLRELLRNVYDIERLLGKLSFDRANARDLKALEHSITAAYAIYVVLKEAEHSSHLELLLGTDFEEHIGELKYLEHRIASILLDELPITVTEGSMIKDGINAEIDELRILRHDAKSWLLDFQAREQSRTGIPTLRVKFTNAFGYFIEISKAQSVKAPSDYVRRQTLVNAERYVTEELKVYEEKILGSESKLAEIEYRIFQDLRNETLDRRKALQYIAEGLATIDVIGAFSEVSVGQKFVKPKLTEERLLVIDQGRHPVIEALLRRERGIFVPNNTHLDTNCHFALITGPNMAGKSTYLRQTALICYLAHIGCFVPAREATIPLLDRIFTRVGASDNLSRGASTFMVEMQETAHILHHATERSLVILDELGRGTSTYDGLSLAWAVVEELHDKIKAFAMFATHYHELIDITEKLSHAKNVSVAVSKKGQHVVFLHKIIPGGAPQSYGIEVAKLAGLPKQLVDRASNHLAQLEKGHAGSDADEAQLSIFHEGSEITSIDTKATTLIEELSSLDITTLRPIDALNWLADKQNSYKS